MGIVFTPAVTACLLSRPCPSGAQEERVPLSRIPAAAGCSAPRQRGLRLRRHCRGVGLLSGADLPPWSSRALNTVPVQPHLGPLVAALCTGSGGHLQAACLSRTSAPHCERRGSPGRFPKPHPSRLSPPSLARHSPIFRFYLHQFTFVFQRNTSAGNWLF